MCPYCFEESKPSEIHFRCSNLACPTDEDDRLLAKYERLPDNAPLLKRVWIIPKPDSIKNVYTAPESEICPKCHNHIPKSTTEGRDIIISIAGTRDSGKSHFLGVLIRHLRRNVMRHFDEGSMAYFDDDVEERYKRTFEDFLYGESPEKLSQTHSSVVSIQEGTYKPYIFTLEFDKNSGERSNYNIIFFDAAGEDLEKLENMKAVTKYIGKSSGIILLFDPTKIPEVATRLPKDIRDVAAVISDKEAGDVLEIIERMSKQIRDANGLSNTESINVPVAAVLSKFDVFNNEAYGKDALDEDVIIPQSAENEVLWDDSPHFKKGLFDVSDSNHVDTLMRGFLNVWDMGASLTSLKKYKACSFFVASAIGKTNKINADNSTLESKPTPHRIEDPLLWVLKEKGIIGSTEKKKTPIDPRHDHDTSITRMKELKKIREKSKKRTKKAIKAVLALMAVSILVVLAIFTLSSMNNFDPFASNYMTTSIPHEERVRLGSSETIYANISVTYNGIGWGRQRIYFVLQPFDGTPVIDGYVERFFSYRLWNDRSIPLFTYDFAPHSDYELTISINESMRHGSRFLLHGE